MERRWLAALAVGREMIKTKREKKCACGEFLGGGREYAHKKKGQENST